MRDYCVLTSSELPAGQRVVPRDAWDLGIQRDRIRCPGVCHVRADVELRGTFLETDARRSHLRDALALDVNVPRYRFRLLNKIFLVWKGFQTCQMLCLCRKRSGGIWADYKSVMSPACRSTWVGALISASFSATWSASAKKFWTCVSTV